MEDDPSFSDVDGDGRADVCDHCPTVASADDDDSDGDGVGDACDLCPLVADPSNADADGDGVGDACDPCQGNLLLEPRRLLLTGFDTARGDDDRLELRASFDVAPDATVDEIAEGLTIDIADVARGIDFEAPLRISPFGRWKHDPQDPAWPWRFSSAPNAFPKLQATLRPDPAAASRAQLHLSVSSGGFASLPVVFPLRATVNYIAASGLHCAKVVYQESGSPGCTHKPNGGLLCR